MKHGFVLASLFESNEIKRQAIIDVVNHLVESRLYSEHGQTLITVIEESGIVRFELGGQPHNDTHNEYLSAFMSGIIEAMQLALAADFSTPKIANDTPPTPEKEEPKDVYIPDVVEFSLIDSEHLARFVFARVCVSPSEAHDFAEAISAGARGQEVRWNWKGSFQGHYVHAKQALWL